MKTLLIIIGVILVISILLIFIPIFVYKWREADELMEEVDRLLEHL
jgi:uncharacterized membrane protein YqiK